MITSFEKQQRASLTSSPCSAGSLNYYYYDSEAPATPPFKESRRLSSPPALPSLLVVSPLSPTSPKSNGSSNNTNNKKNTMICAIFSSFRVCLLFFFCMVTVTMRQILLHTTHFTSECCGLRSVDDKPDVDPFLSNYTPVVVNTSYVDSNGEVDPNALARVWTQIAVSAEFDMDLMPHTVQHYLNVGLDPDYMMITLHHTQPNAPNVIAAEKMLRERFNISRIRVWNGNFSSPQMYLEKMAQRDEAGLDECDWVLKLDSDEHLRVPGNDFISFLEGLSVQNFDQLSTQWVDRIGPNGEIPDIRSKPSLSEQFPVGCSRFSSTAGADALSYKVVAFRNFLHEKRSGHKLDKPSRHNSCRYPVRLAMDHFKWSAPVIAKLRRRMAYYRSQNISWWVESQAFLKELDETDGRVNITNPAYQCTDYLAPEEGSTEPVDKSRLSRLPFIHSFLPEVDVIKKKKDMVDTISVCSRPPQCPTKLARRGQ